MIPIPKKTQIILQAVYAEDLGDQLDELPLKLTADPLEDLSEQALSLELEPVEDPLAAPPDVTIKPDALTAMSKINAPSIGLALSGRRRGMKQALLAAYGGNATTEAAVDRGLLWLKRNQARNGSWSLRGTLSGRRPVRERPCRDSNGVAGLSRSRKHSPIWAIHERSSTSVGLAPEAAKRKR